LCSLQKQQGERPCQRPCLPHLELTASTPPQAASCGAIIQRLQCHGISGNNISSSSSQPFYSFLPVGPVRCERTLSECKTDVSEGVDLELKLGNC
ncbi:Os01g0212500, partial [Oryza sativa Japonica Group]